MAAEPSPVPFDPTPSDALSLERAALAEAQVHCRAAADALERAAAARIDAQEPSAQTDALTYLAVARVLRGDFAGGLQRLIAGAK